MRHRKHTFKIGRKPAHVQALLANQVISLITEGRIKTTVVKAKETKRLAEKVLTLGKKGTLHHRRRAISKLGNVDAVHKLFAEIAPRYQAREGGYTRIVKLGERVGDGAPLCFLEWVEPDNAARPRRSKGQVAEAAVAAEAAPAPEAKDEQK